MKASKFLWMGLLAGILAQNVIAGEIRFIDSATGCAIQPNVSAVSHRTGQKHTFASRDRLKDELSKERHRIYATSLRHKPMEAEVDLTEPDPYTHEIMMEPMQLPPELVPSRVISFRRLGAHYALGYVVDADSLTPLANVRVTAPGTTAQTKTDASGFFEFHVPTEKPLGDSEMRSLVFEAPSHDTEVHEFRCDSDGDSTFRVRMSAKGTKRTIAEQPVREAQILSPSITPNSTSPSNATVRIPRTIRVQITSTGAIQYLAMEDYVKHSLPREWIASWASNAGGSNSLKAGAVANRSYAVAKLQAASTTAKFDICDSTACQVFGSTTDSRTDSAVDQTAGYVMVSGTTITSTEYSAEDNSAGNTCGDGYTEPSTTGPVCIYDPVCSGETRNGHGRGMCQWGTAKWATGLKYAGNSGSGGSANGFPKKDWIWICNHYFPTLDLVHATPLVVGDDVKANVAGLTVRANADGSISNATASGMNCPQVGTEASGNFGVIIASTVNPNPFLEMTNDTYGFTWYYVQWNDGLTGWSPENWLQRVIPAPTAPTTITATAIATNQVNVNWVDTSGAESGFLLQRALASGGPWAAVTNTGANVTNFIDRTVVQNTTYYYRVRAFNLFASTSFATGANATTPAVSPTLNAIADKSMNEQALLTFTCVASAPDFVWPITDFEFFDTGTSTGTVLFRNPNTSGSSSTNISIPPNFASVSDLFSTTGNSSQRALFVSCNFTNPTDPWLRLTTASAANLPNPVIDLTKQLRFSIYCDKAVKVALGCRETTTAAGTAYGSDGGTTGGIEWVGVSGQNGDAPIATHSVAAGVWTNLVFDLSKEQVRNFSGGNGILQTASGLGVLEHLALVPTGGTGTYSFYFDNFAVAAPRVLTFSLDSGFPTGATINPTNGVFAWTPTEGQGPGVYPITVRVTDNSTLPLSATRSFNVTVSEINKPPVLTQMSNVMVHAGMTVSFTNSASDPDLPANTLSFSLGPGFPAGAAIDSSTGVFTCPTSDSQAGTTTPITVRVSDNGSPAMSDTKTFQLSVVARSSVSANVSGDTLTLAWSAIAGQKYRVHWKTNLDDANWTDLADVTASDTTASIADTLGSDQRFYRIILVQ